MPLVFDILDGGVPDEGWGGYYLSMLLLERRMVLMFHRMLLTAVRILVG